MKRLAATAVLVAFALPSLGCGWIQPPRLLAPAGPAAYQQHRATRFDPYPDDTYAPEVVGGRPREYEKPAAIPEQNQPLQRPLWYGSPASYPAR